MDLLIIRHANACPATADQDDAQRELSSEGRLQFARVVERIDRLPFRIHWLFHSPWRRATQTAEILRPIIAPSHDNCIAATELAHAPNDALFDLIRFARTTDTACIALVGHQPWLSTLIALLLEGDRTTGYRFILEPGGMAWLQGEPKPQGMQLRSLVSPTIL